MNKKDRATLCLLVATLIWGSTFVAQSVAMDHMGPFTFQALRCALAVAFLLPVIHLFDRGRRDGKTYWPRWRDARLWRAGILCGVPLFLASALQQMGIVDTDAGKSAFLTSMYIVIVPVIGIFRKERPPKALPLCLILAVAGLYCLTGTDISGVQRGDLLLIGCALVFAVQITCVDLFAGTVDPLRLNTIQCLVCALLSALVMVFTEQPQWPAIVQSWGSLAYAGVLSMGVAYSLQILGQRGVSPSVATLIMSLESVVAVLCGSVLLQEQLTKWELLGCCLVFAAVLLAQLPEKKRA